ncbi:MAG: hypothetical protein V2I56_11800 [Desulfobacteraceae bacterium]|nr:hypothetical protein [Desulfobacteraceae bacterium]
MGGRFGKYGDTKRKAKIRRSGLVRVKGKKRNRIQSLSDVGRKNSRIESD